MEFSDSLFSCLEDLHRLVKELQPKLKAPEEVHLQVRGWGDDRFSPMASQKWPVFFGMERSFFLRKCCGISDEKKW